MTEQRYTMKAVVRHRRPDDDEYIDPEDAWPEELRWVSAANWWERGVWTGGCISPFATFEEALADAIADADALREQNREWAALSEPTA